GPLAEGGCEGDRGVCALQPRQSRARPRWRSRVPGQIGLGRRIPGAEEPRPLLWRHQGAISSSRTPAGDDKRRKSPINTRMAEFTETLRAGHIAMIEQQPMFFVATAAEDARINLSPKGYDSFRVISPERVAYLDLGGSGNETNAHLLADGRITIMFCNFQQPALILRIYGRGQP